MVELQPPDEKSSLRRFSLGIGSTYRRQGDVIQVDDSGHIKRFKDLGFEEVKDGEEDESEPFDVDEADYDELKEFAKNAELDVDLRLGGDKLRSSIKEELD